MGKEKPGFLTPKAIANRIKAKGLQKLRWYCQMCEKQCRDENGFKCHTMSESHQRQLLLFADNSHKFMDEFSRDFTKGYVTTLKRRFGTKRVHANIVYQEYINDRDHIHMNATRWLTLTDYVQWLGRQGICVVDETEKGWFVTYIDRDPETLRRQMEVEKKKKLDLDDRQRQQMFLEKQIERAKEQDDKPFSEPTELKKNENEVLKISFMKTRPVLKSEETAITSSKVTLKEEKLDEEERKELVEKDAAISDGTKAKEELNEIKETKFTIPVDKPAKSTPISSASALAKSTAPSTSKTAEKRKHSALDDIMLMEEKKREKQNRKDYWLHKNIVVKITTSKLGEKFHKKKGMVIDVVDSYTGVVKLLETGAVIKIDQAHLETVLPALGKQVLIVNGAYRGELATLDQINEKEFNAKVTISAGPLNGRIVNRIQYEDISKLHQD